jgi:hypothetical protein
MARADCMLNKGLALRARVYVGVAGLALLLLTGWPQVRGAAPGAPGSPRAPRALERETAVSADDWATVQARLKATDEEWSVIGPVLQRMANLREEVQAKPGLATGNRRPGGMLDSPMGGTSLDAPVMRSGSGGRGGNGPFDPKTAPGANDRGQGMLGALGRVMGRAMIGLMVPDQSRPVQTLMTELQTLAYLPGATDQQIWDKLAEVRAARKKAARELEAAQRELVPFLTVDQTAVLVSLGYFD